MSKPRNNNYVLVLLIAYGMRPEIDGLYFPFLVACVDRDDACEKADRFARWTLAEEFMAEVDPNEPPTAEVIESLGGRVYEIHLIEAAAAHGLLLKLAAGDVDVE